jgi:DNA topoisomerase-2
VEPEFYVPILPFALMNGISGIGTGFSCNIPAFNPLQVVEYLRNKLTDEETDEMEFAPYYEGFKGSIKKIADNKYLVKGLYEKIGEDKIRITELPVGTWTMPYITFLEGLMDGTTAKPATAKLATAKPATDKKSAPSIKDFTSICTEVSVDITVVFPKDKLAELESVKDATTGVNGLEKLLKLTTTISSTNMHMFDSERKLHKYGSVQNIIDDFYIVRMEAYRKRKAYLMKALQNKLVKLSNRARYILANLDGSVDLRKKTAQQVTDLLTGLKFDQIDGDFKYLIKMPMDSVTQENVDAILKEKANAEQELKKLESTTLETIWLEELTVFEKEYGAYKLKREVIQSGEKKPKIVKIKKTTI